MISNPPPSSVDHLVQHCLPRIAKALTPIAFVQCILAAYTKYGIDPTQALAEAQITPDQLANSEARITVGQMEKISGAAMRQLDVEGLAPVIVEEIVAQLKTIKQTGLPVLLVEQNLEVCTQLADRHYIIEQGRIVYESSNADFIADTAVKDRYLGVGMA